MEQFAQTVAKEIAPKRINVVSPGMVDTPMFGPDGDEERQKKLEKGTACHLIPRAGFPDEIAQGILFVTTNEFVTGSVIDIDGGWICS